MNILLIHQYFLEPDDGGGSRFNEMTKQWTDKGHTITVLAGMMHANGSEKRSEYKGKFFVRKKYEEVDVLRCHVSESYNSGFIGRLWGYFSFVFSSIWVGLFKTKSKFDVILVTSPPLFVGITAYVLSLFKRIPFVFEVRDLWPESAIDTGVVTNKVIIKFALWFESFIYRKAKLINVLTPAFQDVLVNKKDVPKDKVICIPNGSDFSLAEKVSNSNFNRIQFREKLGWNGKFVLIYIGAHGVANDLLQVVRAADYFSTRNDKIHFVLIGDGMEKKNLVKEANDKGLINIEFMDSVSKAEVFKYIYSADMGMSVLKKVKTFTTIYSNKTFDYMSCKTPVFLAIDGVSRKLINEAECGFYVEPENLDSWIKGLEEILRLPSEKLESMGINGYNFAIENFDRSKLAIQYVDLIEKCIMSKKGKYD